MLSSIFNLYYIYIILYIYLNCYLITLFQKITRSTQCFCRACRVQRHSGEKTSNIETIITKGIKFSPLQAGSRIGLNWAHDFADFPIGIVHAAYYRDQCPKQATDCPCVKVSGAPIAQQPESPFPFPCMAG